MFGIIAIFFTFLTAVIINFMVQSKICLFLSLVGIGLVTGIVTLLATSV